MSADYPEVNDIFVISSPTNGWARWRIVGDKETERGREVWPACYMDGKWLDERRKPGDIRNIHWFPPNTTSNSTQWNFERHYVIMRCAECSEEAPEDDYLCLECRGKL